MNKELAAQINTNEERAGWAADFRQRCLEMSQSLGDDAMSSQRPDDAIAHYSAALSLNPALPQRTLVKRSQAYIMKGLWEDALNDTNQLDVLTQDLQTIELDPLSPWNHESVLGEWAKAKLTAQDGSWKNTLSYASNFKVPRLTVIKALFERLEAVRRIRDETECFHEMMRELEQEIESKEAKQILSDFLDPRNRLRFKLSPRFLFDFKSRSCKKLEDLGDIAVTAKQYERAASLYSDALGLDPPSPQALFLKRSKAHAAGGKWEHAINDADEATTLDPMSLANQEQKYMALRGSGRYQDALYAFETLLVKLSESPDADTREHYLRYKNTRTVIRKTIQDAIRDLPRVLIDTASGRLCTRPEQASAFEVSPTCMELVSSMTTNIDYRPYQSRNYEPLYEKVIRVPVYDLEVFPTHEKLQKFCKVARDAGFHWAWSDTCCIDKADHFVLQEALVSMFSWYRGASLTIVFLLGVSPPSEHGDLVNSIWNSRIWTFQEYHASKVVRFYNDDWTLYRNLDAPNHKMSPEIVSEMEEATGVSTDALTALQPGLDNIREKLCLASQRETTVPEDAAYALFGIFSVSVTCRLCSGDTSILAWTGRSGSFNSCLPSELTVFGELPTTHIPHTISTAEMETMTTGLRASSPSMPQLMKLYDELLKLSAPLFSGKRMRLPCIAFRLGHVSATLVASERVFYVKTAAFGRIEIRTTENISRLDSLILVHPWIDFLLDRRLVEDIGDADDQSFPSDLESSSSVLDPADAACPALSDTVPFGSASPFISTDTGVEAEAMQLLARLRQPFSALLLAPTRRNMAEYKRVATDCIIRVQIREDVPVSKLVANVRMLDVL
ncbi:hypothetical protein JVU11DRAFT_3961 [Chiua virens]|nr:hypothetical protein JVU11DRAFT_3961 [Chiua virens]